MHRNVPVALPNGLDHKVQVVSVGGWLLYMLKNPELVGPLAQSQDVDLFVAFDGKTAISIFQILKVLPTCDFITLIPVTGI